MRSPAFGPTMPQPMTRSLASSNSSLVMPSSPERQRASRAAHGNTPLPYLSPCAFASFSVSPAQATSGSV